MKLTTGRIAALTCPPEKSQIFMWSDNGLGVRVTAGSKSYIFQSRIHGKAFRITIGDIKVWTIPQAEAEARRLQVIVDNGLDPRKVKAEIEADAKAKASFKNAQSFKDNVLASEAWLEYVKERTSAKVNGKLEWGSRHLEHIALLTQTGDNKLREGALVPLLKMRLVDLDAVAVKSWLNKEAAKAPASAAKAFNSLRAFIEWCSKHNVYSEITQAVACKHDSVKRDVPIGKIRPNDAIRKAQIKPWFDQVLKINNSVISAYLRTLLLTGARRNELSGLRWTEVDFQWKSLTIRDKVKGQRVIPLTPYVEKIIATLPRRNEFVFSSTSSKSGFIENPAKQHNQALDNAGLPHITIHGLRRSFATLSEWCEVPTGIVAQIMGHAASAIAEKHYIQRELDLLHIWHVRIETWILDQAGISPQKLNQSKSPLSIVK